MFNHDLVRGRLRAVLAFALSASMAPAWAMPTPACARDIVPLVLQDVPQQQALQAEFDAEPLRGRRVWVGVVAHNEHATPLRVPLMLAFDRRPDGTAMRFNQYANLYAAPHADGYVVLSAWVDPGTHRVSVRAAPAKGTDMSGVTLRMQCSPEPIAEGTPSAQQALLDEALDLYFTRAAHPPSDPERLRALAQARATGAELPDDVLWAMRAMLHEAGDQHSYLVPGSGRGQFYDMLSPTPPRVELRADGIAVVALSQVAFDNDPAASAAYARDLRAAIDRVQSRHPHGWIVDLRGDGGGDMWPMLAGLSALVDGPKVGAFVSREGTEAWVVAAGESGTDRDPAVAKRATHDPLAISSAVAVLIGPGTASSGEATAIAFEARPRTRFFGKPTLGLYNSGIMQYTLSDGTMFGVVHVLNADRTGRVREGALVPDTVVADGDDAEQAAAAWLLAQPALNASSRSAPAPAASAAPSPD